MSPFYNRRTRALMVRWHVAGKKKGLTGDPVSPLLRKNAYWLAGAVAAAFL